MPRVHELGIVKDVHKIIMGLPTRAGEIGPNLANVSHGFCTWGCFNTSSLTVDIQGNVRPSWVGLLERYGQFFHIGTFRDGDLKGGTELALREESEATCSMVLAISYNPRTSCFIGVRVMVCGVWLSRKFVPATMGHARALTLAWWEKASYNMVVPQLSGKYEPEENPKGKDESREYVFQKLAAERRTASLIVQREIVSQVASFLVDNAEQSNV